MTNFLSSLVTSPFLLVKLLILAGLLIYILFALATVRQVSMMAKTLMGTIDPWLKSIALVHLLAAVLVFLLAWLFL